MSLHPAHGHFQALPAMEVSPLTKSPRCGPAGEETWGEGGGGRHYVP